MTVFPSRRHFLLAGGALLAGGVCPRLKLDLLPGTALAAMTAPNRPAAFSSQPWSAQAWAAAGPVYAKIQRHPFVRGLAAGTLPVSRFLFYLEQNALYLQNYAAVLSAIGARLPELAQQKLLAGYVTDTVTLQTYTEDLYFSLCGSRLNTARLQACPSCLMYMGHEARLAAFAPVETAMAGALPCFVVYQEVGNYLLAAQKGQKNRYSDWIAGFADAGYAASVANAIALCDRLAAQTGTEGRQAMTRAFVQSCKLEWLFWDSAWRLENWPV